MVVATKSNLDAARRYILTDFFRSFVSAVRARADTNLAPWLAGRGCSDRQADPDAMEEERLIEREKRGEVRSEG